MLAAVVHGALAVGASWLPLFHDPVPALTSLMRQLPWIVTPVTYGAVAALVVAARSNEPRSGPAVLTGLVFGVAAGAGHMLDSAIVHTAVIIALTGLAYLS